MKKQGSKPAKTTKAKTAESIYVCIDYPQEKVRIDPGNYSVRISSAEGYKPEVSINGGKWQECRPSVGFWWFDWKGISRGSHTIEARIRKGKKLLKKVLSRCSC